MSVRSLQRRFPIDDIMLRLGRRYLRSSREVRNRAKFDVFGPPNFGGRGTQISDRIL